MTKMYGLRELMYQKYGEAKFAIACEIVARFVGFHSEYKWTAEKVLLMCNTTRYDVEISISDGQRFKQLFGIESVDQLFKEAPALKGGVSKNNYEQFIHSTNE